jgi:S-adenosylmethionine decarboxylase
MSEVCTCFSPPLWRNDVRDLAPNILRQRLVVEGSVSSPIEAADIVRYLKELGRVTEMQVLTEPVTHSSPMYGWAGWVHWETSGAHFYAWDAPHQFFSVEIYTCKAFDADEVTAFTAQFFKATETVSRGF